MIDDTLLEAEEKMDKAVEVAKEDFATIRTGRANAAMFSRIFVDYYGTPTPLQQLASFNVTEARTILIAPFDKSSMTAVERALRDRKLLDATWVDGYFGTETVAAYARYQRSLGWSGLDANGLPGRTSLTSLGAGRYTVTHVITPGAKVTRDGATVDARTDAMLDEAERLLGRELRLDQGSYNPGGDPTSAGTHDGGGVVDVSVAGMTAATRTKVARVLRRVGFAAWVRNPSQGDWPWHIHAAAINDTDLSSQAQHQTGDYYLGLDGLADRAADDGPRVPIHTWEEYQRTH